MGSIAPMHEHDIARHLCVTRAGLGVLLRAYSRPDGTATDRTRAVVTLQRSGYLDAMGVITAAGSRLAARARVLAGRAP